MEPLLLSVCLLEVFSSLWPATERSERTCSSKSRRVLSGKRGSRFLVSSRGVARAGGGLRGLEHPFVMPCNDVI